MQVMIIEDNAIIREDLALALTEAGHTVAAKPSSYRAALQWLAGNAWPDACVVDLDLGVKLAVANAFGEEGRRLLALLTQRSVRTVIYTGHSREDAMLDGLDMRAVYVSKLHPPDAVISALNDLAEVR